MNPPTNITLSKNKKLLTVSFENDNFDMSSEYLRVYSPSAEVRGHGPGQETLQLNKQNVTINSLAPMGNYAIAIHFCDGHTTGIYSWSYLYHLGVDKDELWKDYCERVKNHNAKNSRGNQNYHEVSIK